MQSEQIEADGIEIIFYTDPLCCWSWGFEPQWRKLQYELQDKIGCRYVMTGLLPSWKQYTDPVYSVSRPQQMGPVWLEASEASGMPMPHKIWVTDPPASSYPACIAVKSIELQSKFAGARYLRLLREAVMLTGRNIARQDILVEVAVRLSKEQPGLIDLQQFESDLTNERGLEAFRADWQETQNRNISRTPTLILRARNTPAIMLTGYRPYAVLLQAIEQVAPGLYKNRAIDPGHYTHHWGNLTERELAEIL